MRRKLLVRCPTQGLIERARVYHPSTSTYICDHYQLVRPNLHSLRGRSRMPAPECPRNISSTYLSRTLLRIARRRTTASSTWGCQRWHSTPHNTTRRDVIAPSTWGCQRWLAKVPFRLRYCTFRNSTNSVKTVRRVAGSVFRFRPLCLSFPSVVCL